MADRIKKYDERKEKDRNSDKKDDALMVEEAADFSRSPLSSCKSNPNITSMVTGYQ
jgi:hypothetical protein